MGQEWLDLITESDAPITEDVLDGVMLPHVCEADDEGSIILDHEVQLVLEHLSKEGLDGALKRLKKLNGEAWNTRGRTAKQLLNMVRSQSFIGHHDHLQRMRDGRTGGLRDIAIFNQKGEAWMAVNGSTEWKNPRERYAITLRFQNFDRILADQSLTYSDKARLLLRDKLKVHCDCKAFRYFYAYTAHQKGFGLLPEMRPAEVRNPRNKGGICKHLHHALQTLGTNTQKIAGQLKAYDDKRKKERGS